MKTRDEFQYHFLDDMLRFIDFFNFGNAATLQMLGSVALRPDISDGLPFSVFDLSIQNRYRQTHLVANGKHTIVGDVITCYASTKHRWVFSFQVLGSFNGLVLGR